MSKNKYRLTKQKHEKFGPINREVISGKVILSNSERESENVIINNYFKVVQKQRYDKYISKQTNKKNKNQLLSEKNNLLSRDSILNKKSKDRILNSIPVAIQINDKEAENDKKRNKETILLNKFVMIRDSEEDIINTIYSKLYSKIYIEKKGRIKVDRDMLRDNSKKTYEFLKVKYENKREIEFHTSLSILKDIHQYLKNIELNNTYGEHLKHCNKCDQEQEKYISQCDECNKRAQKMIKEKLINRTHMNYIDIGKVYYHNEINKVKFSDGVELENIRQEEILLKKISDGIELENIRQEEILLKKISESIIRANNNIIYDKANIDINFNSLDLFGGNDVLKNIIDKKKFLDSRNVIEIYGKLKGKFDKEIYCDIDSILNNLTELRSNVVHKKCKNIVELFNIKNHSLEDEEKQNEYNEKLENAYRKISENRYISNNVYSIFEETDIEKIKIDNSNLEIVILENNYLPRFSKVLNKMKYNEKFEEEVFSFMSQEDEALKNAYKFLLKEVYMSKFKGYVNTEKIHSELLEKINDMVTSSCVIKKDIQQMITDNKGMKHHEFHNEMSKEISKGSYKDILNVWHSYISRRFYIFIKDNYEFLLEESEKKENKKEPASVKKLELDHVMFYLSQLLTKREVNELYNSIISYIQYKISKEEDEEEKLKIVEEYLHILKILKVQISLVQYVETFSGQDNKFTEKEEQILKIVLENEKDMKNYKSDNNEDISTKIKNLRFLEEQNTDIVIDKNIKGIVKSRYFQEKTRHDFRYQDKLTELKEKLKGLDKIAKSKEIIHLQESVIDKDFRQSWEECQQYNLSQNMVKLYTPIKIHKLSIEIFSLFFRVVQSIERDLIFMYIAYAKSNLEGSANKIIEKSRENIPLKKFEKYDKKSWNKFLYDIEFDIVKYETLRNEIAHVNYFNDNRIKKSLKDIKSELDKLLAYNFKRRKALRLSYEYILSKNDLVEESGTLVSMSHQYAYYTVDGNGKKIQNNFKKLKLMSNEEVKLFDNVISGKNE